MSEKSYFERRHIFLINKEFQGRFAAFVITILIGYSFILLLFQKLAKTVSFPLMIPIVFGILIIFIGVASIFYSHRFAGPLFAINRATKEMTKGDLLIKIRPRASTKPRPWRCWCGLARRRWPGALSMPGPGAACRCASWGPWCCAGCRCRC